MKDYVRLMLSSVKKKLTKKERKFCFEIFGIDFMIDMSGHVYIIEVNTNPCIEESCPLL